MPPKENSNIIKIFCWNVNGIRAIQKKGFHDWVKQADPDILCLQETKASEDQLEDSLKNINRYSSYFCSAERKGYSGVATYTRVKPVNVRKGFGNTLYDVEGRVIETEFENFTLFNVYFPNGGRGAERVRYKLDFYDELFFNAERVRKRKKNVIVCGDYNTAHREIDLARPKENSENTGFLPIEREWIDKIINLGYVDIFREYNKEPNWYTYWDYVTSARERNVGWRIDYFFVSKEARSIVVDTKIHTDVIGSDHCPIELKLAL